MDPSDDCVEVIASQFFDKSVRLFSIQCGENPSVVWERYIDTQCGAAFASVLTDFDQEKEGEDETDQDSPVRHEVIDAGSTIPMLQRGDAFSHLLVTSHTCSSSDASHLDTERSSIGGGSVFAYRVPDDSPDAWKTEPWQRTTVASGFSCKSKLANIINPGAPGFCYTFPARRGDRSRRPLLAVAGDCAESAYIFRPETNQDPSDPDPSTKYKLMVEVECESTVGSIGVGYGDFLGAIGQPSQESSEYAKVYIPCYEKNKVLMFALGDGGASKQ